MGNKKYQGELMHVVRRTGEIHMIHVFENSSDFPDYDIVLMGEGGKFPVERVPINEELWRRIGQALGYRFVIRKNKDDAKRGN